jgi:hypothetical protein
MLAFVADKGPAENLDQDVVFIKKPRAQYSDLARQNHVEGTVTVAIECLADGNIGFVFPFRTLPDGLTDQAIEAAKLIEFEPAKIGSHTAPTVKIQSDNFNIYKGKNERFCRMRWRSKIYRFSGGKTWRQKVRPKGERTNEFWPSPSLRDHLMFFYQYNQLVLVRIDAIRVSECFASRIESVVVSPLIFEKNLGNRLIAVMYGFPFFLSFYEGKICFHVNS